MKKRALRCVAAIVCALLLATQVFARDLIPVGTAVGLEFGDGLIVTQLNSDEARASGLEPGDLIVAIDGQAVADVTGLRKLVACGDKQVQVTVIRKNRELTFPVCVREDQGERQLGLYVRSGVAGIGTVTWYDPETGTFGALGHGISDKSGNLIAVSGGRAVSATVIGVKTGQKGDPGKLQGSYNPEATLGTITDNTRQGIFGTTETGFSGTAIPVAESCQVTKGDAKILCNVTGDTVREYSVKILKIDPNSETRNLLIQVTDPALLSVTGGIVQGMSGSPIIQAGKLIGAVTHVLVNDPTTGYGIFIENMLDAAA